jgi:hypothetical protein
VAIEGVKLGGDPHLDSRHRPASRNEPATVRLPPPRPAKRLPEPPHQFPVIRKGDERTWPVTLGRAHLEGRCNLHLRTIPAVIRFGRVNRLRGLLIRRRDMHDAEGILAFQDRLRGRGLAGTDHVRRLERIAQARSPRGFQEAHQTGEPDPRVQGDAGPVRR